MNTKRIVITGGPGTGKSSIINELIHRGYACLEEISRQITIEAQKQGVSQLFLTNPLLFSERLLEGREQQYISAETLPENIVFFDRGVPDVVAYMDYIGDTYPQRFIDACQQCQYDYVFILKPWQDIYTSDSERYENFDQALKIHEHLLNTYQTYDYHLLDVPFDTVENRADHILKTLNLL
ncbi:ATP-binding protein [Flavobacteriaceae bacterium XHP0103]|uniref:ATP-binding protein n=1 Tax=Marixanthotalea marina TaxID=2844359 RepID=UPI002989D6A6|nr:ATP-binding protein [Marixanthotalea marina]MBU3821583.1 ATP-binding protein [Marixanthotalea marina]